MATVQEEVRQIPENDQRLIRTMLRLDDDGTLPRGVVDAYWSLKTLTDRVGITHMSGEALAMICWMSKHTTPSDPFDWFKSRWKDGSLAVGSPISVLWRDKWVTASIQNYNPQSGKVAFVLDNDPNERELPLERFSLPTAVHSTR